MAGHRKSATIAQPGRISDCLEIVQNKNNFPVCSPPSLPNRVEPDAMQQNRENSRWLKFSLLTLCALCGQISPAPAASPTAPDERDRLVFDVVFSRLLTDADYNMRHVALESANVVLDERTPEYAGAMIRPEQVNVDIGKDHTVPRSVQDDLLPRNGKPGTHKSKLASFADLKLGERVEIAKLPGGGIVEFERAHPNARCWVSAWLPGYSKDGKQAIVRANIGPWAHGATVTMFLEKDGDKWTVKWSRLALYA